MQIQSIHSSRCATASQLNMQAAQPYMACAATSCPQLPHSQCPGCQAQQAAAAHLSMRLRLRCPPVVHRMRGVLAEAEGCVQRNMDGVKQPQQRMAAWGWRRVGMVGHEAG